eukprot:GILK01003138.1.p1 GENE.GILK01003138.1~~GILK01003138.1.p1  ORF type:complete len:762 (+),score=171.51 GILK01003138.1:72-2288(+)
MAAVLFNKPNYAEELDKCRTFFTEFKSADVTEHPIHGRKKYMQFLQQIADRTRTTMEVELDDVLDYEQDEEFVKNIQQNTPRYITLFSKAADEVLPPTTNDIPSHQQDVFDVMFASREKNMNANGEPLDARSGLPAELRRRYELVLLPLKKTKVLPLRGVKADSIGHLVTVKGIVIRASDVKPLCVVATYTCDTCGFEIYQPVTSKSFMPQVDCPTEQCKLNKTRGRVFQQIRGSRFIRYQELRIQEPSDQVPMGHVPRSMTVLAKGEATRLCSPGDLITIDGVFLPSPHTGFRAMRAGLIADTFLEAYRITRQKKTYAEFSLSEEMLQRIDNERQSADIYTKLSKSLAPEIFGHEDVKKALLLLLVGGVTKEMADGMKIRGDINVLLMGDPGVAKSQLLKHIVSVAPRGVYTTGKGSSGVGLTAAVMKDPITGELTLEGGALVLADMGICCIDEFDKMEERDRTAIHEVMEQQTVSIAKAGITTTLNARTAILAAANPLYGRYNRNQSPHENINLPAALLSRFDLLFLILDKPDTDNDMALARHVTYVHRFNKHPSLEFETLDAAFMRAYIAHARTYTPDIPKNLTDYIVGMYAELRQGESNTEKSGYSYTTPRTLLGILRLSQALARLRFGDEVDRSDVDEAMRLMHASKISIVDDEPERRARDPKSMIFDIIRDVATKTGKTAVKYMDVEPRVLAKGYSKVQLTDTLSDYEELNVLQLTDNGQTITFIHPDEMSQ